MVHCQLYTHVRCRKSVHSRGLNLHSAVYDAAWAHRSGWRSAASASSFTLSTDMAASTLRASAVSSLLLTLSACTSRAADVRGFTSRNMREGADAQAVLLGSLPRRGGRKLELNSACCMMKSFTLYDAIGR